MSQENEPSQVGEGGEMKKGRGKGNAPSVTLVEVLTRFATQTLQVVRKDKRQPGQAPFVADRDLFQACFSCLLTRVSNSHPL